MRVTEKTSGMRRETNPLSLKDSKDRPMVISKSSGNRVPVAVEAMRKT
jgi:hypothetical protein